MIELATGWTMDVDRGPDWLFLTLRHDGYDDDQGIDLADSAWQAMRQHFSGRLVLDLHGVPLINSSFVGQMVLLHKRITSDGGVMRVCGLSATNARVLEIARLSDRFTNFDNRDCAVRGDLPSNPR